MRKSSNYKHGMSGTRFYKIWSNMIDRCLNKKHGKYSYYGGRGIKVCDDWLQFVNFYRDMYDGYIIHCGQYTERDTSIDRINNQDGYSLKNCRWATWSQQNVNRNLPSASKYTGVTKHGNKWAAKISVKNNMKYIGLYNTPEEAHHARLQAIKKYREVTPKTIIG